jgi:hypothetical protein
LGSTGFTIGLGSTGFATGFNSVGLAAGTGSAGLAIGFGVGRAALRTGCGGAAGDVDAVATSGAARKQSTARAFSWAQNWPASICVANGPIWTR